MKANAAQIRAAMASPASAIRLYLLHGADEAGAADLAALLGRAMGEGAERVDLDGATLKADPARLADEAASLSLFVGARYVRVGGAGEESLAAFTSLLDAGQGGAPVVAIAPAVRTTAKIVKLAIESPRAMAFACYPPDAAGAERLVGTIAAEAGLTLDAGVAARIVAASGGDRAVMTREIEKFALFLDASPGRPQRLDQAALDALGASLDEGETAPLVAALVEGDAAALAEQLALLGERGTSPIPWLRQIVRRLILFAEMRGEIDRGEPVGGVMKRHRVFFREEAATAAALRRWTPAMLAGAIDRVRAAERAVMRPGNAGEVVAAQAVTEIARRIRARR